MTNLFLAFSLAPDVLVHLTFTGRVTQDAIDKLILLLQVTKDTYPTAGADGATR